MQSTFAVFHHLAPTPPSWTISAVRLDSKASKLWFLIEPKDEALRMERLLTAPIPLAPAAAPATGLSSVFKRNAPAPAAPKLPPLPTPKVDGFPKDISGFHQWNMLPAGDLEVLVVVDRRYIDWASGHTTPPFAQLPVGWRALCDDLLQIGPDNSHLSFVLQKELTNVLNPHSGADAVFTYFRVDPEVWFNDPSVSVSLTAAPLRNSVAPQIFQKPARRIADRTHVLGASESSESVSDSAHLTRPNTAAQAHLEPAPAQEAPQAYTPQRSIQAPSIVLNEAPNPSALNEEEATDATLHQSLETMEFESVDTGISRVLPILGQPKRKTERENFDITNLDDFFGSAPVDSTTNPTPSRSVDSVAPTNKGSVNKRPASDRPQADFVPPIVPVGSIVQTAAHNSANAIAAKNSQMHIQRAESTRYAMEMFAPTPSAPSPPLVQIPVPSAPAPTTEPTVRLAPIAPPPSTPSVPLMAPDELPPPNSPVWTGLVTGQWTMDIKYLSLKLLISKLQIQYNRSHDPVPCAAELYSFFSQRTKLTLHEIAQLQVQMRRFGN